MIELLKIVEALKPIKTIGQLEKGVKNVISLNEDNQDPNVIMWISEKNSEKIASIKVGVVICNNFSSELVNKDVTYLIVENPRLSFQVLLSHFFIDSPLVFISSSAYISQNATLGKDCFIGHNVVIEDFCSIGNNVKIDSNSIIKKGTVIGNNVIIGCNCTIGGVGFGYEKDSEGRYIFIPHIGNVVIYDNVEIGNNSCIDRAVIGSTILNENVKVDNLVHIAHSVEIGKNSLIIANAMIAGSVTIGENCWIAPSASIINAKKIGNNATVGLSAVVVKDVEDNQTIVGNPGEELSVFLKKKKQIEIKLLS